MYDTVEERIAAVQRELEAAERVHVENAAAVAKSGPIPSRRRKQGSSIVYSVRLTPAEVDALEREAAMRNLAPTVLARNLIRVGLSSPRSRAVSDALIELEKGMATLRTVVE